MEDLTQIKIQNALRVITLVLKEDESLVTVGGDLIDFTSMNQDSLGSMTLRTQDLAEVLYKRK